MKNFKKSILLPILLSSIGLVSCSSTEFASTAPRSRARSNDLKNNADVAVRGNGNAVDDSSGNDGNGSDGNGIQSDGDGDSDAGSSGSDNSGGSEIGATGKTDTLDNGDIASASDDACFSTPTSDSDTSSKSSGGLFKTTIFHKSIAVDPGKTNSDLASNFGLTPYPVSPPETMDMSTFSVGSKALKAAIDDGITELEYFAFAHQFNMGLDKITIDVTTTDEKLHDVSTTNIYSAYGYVSIKNMRMESGAAYGDIDVFSFNYHPDGTSGLDRKLQAAPSYQDATDIIGPASEATTAKVSKKDVKLENLKIVIQIGADSYDSVQYRAIRANLWSPTNAPKAPKLCNK